MPAADTSTGISPFFGSGSGASPSFSTSGPPNSSTTIALMPLLLSLSTLCRSRPPRDDGPRPEALPPCHAIDLDRGGGVQLAGAPPSMMQGDRRHRRAAAPAAHQATEGQEAALTARPDRLRAPLTQSD